MSIVTVALAQVPQTNDIEKNLWGILSAFTRLPKKTDLVCFPETALTGETTNAPSRYHEAISRETKKRGIWCLYDAYVTTEDDQIFNQAILLDRQGEVAYTYEKKHLWLAEPAIRSQDKNRVIATDFGKIGIIICWDIAFPEESRRLAKEGAQIIFCPSYWYKKFQTTKVIEALPQVRAFENQVFFAFCDAYAPETAARSRICSPIEVVAAADVREEVLVARINLDEVESYRRTFDCWR